MQITKRSIFIIVLILTGCLSLNQVFCQPVQLKIGISKASPNYVNWLKHADSSIQTVNLYTLSLAAAARQLGDCSGLLLTGGEDVWPGRYGKVNDTARCTEMNPHRDSLEMLLIEKALSLRMPVVGICRGHQILNVYLGGTLIIDIPADYGKFTIHQCDDYLTCHHAVGVMKTTLLARISRCDSSQVTSNHHQAVERLSPQLIANATSSDNLIEGIEWQNPDGKSFLLGVQWHPERMDLSNPLSGPIATEFIRQSTLYFSKKQKNQQK